MKHISLPAGVIAAMSMPSEQSASAVRAAGTVMAYTQGLRGYASEHELMTRMEVVRRLAQLKGYGVSEEFAQSPALGTVYYVPSDTLVGIERAKAMGIRNRDDLFGGVVPHPFVSTKAITHPLIATDAAAPQGWSHAFSHTVGSAVLPGYSVFTRDDARVAANKLFARGPVRIKPVRETGGRGQSVANNMAQLEKCLQGMSDELLMQDGLVLEENLQKVRTLSVGQVWVAGILATYYGFQRLTRANSGIEVYGGSDLTVVRGDFEDLLALGLAHEVHTAVEQALVYDGAAHSCFPGFFASRINYDVVQGVNASGQWCSGVLEQSWRAGGATGAEIAALQAFQADPRRHVVRASCIEVFGKSAAPPPSAVVYFRGVDDQVGPLTKYTIVAPDDYTP